MNRRHFLRTALSLAVLNACSSNKPPSLLVPPPPLLRPKIALALGGGAAKGFAHIGVIKTLEAQGITVDIVTGTSAGSVVGSLYAAGYNGFQLQTLAQQLDESNLRDLTLSTQGFIKGEKLQDFINQQVGNRPIEQLKLPFGAVATDLDNGKRIVFRVGNTGQAVRASCSIPNIFLPVTIRGRRYVDGGLSSPVPVSAALEMQADFVIAVDISSKARNGSPTGFLSLLDQSITIMGERLLNAELAHADVVIRPAVANLGAADFDARHTAILEGERATLAAIPLIKQKIVAKSQALTQGRP